MKSLSETINEKIETSITKETQVVTDGYLSNKKITSTINHTAHKVEKPMETFLVTKGNFNFIIENLIIS